MFSKLSLTFAVAAAFPTITIKEDGKDKQLYIVNPSWYSGGGGTSIDVPQGGRSYLATSDALGPDNFYSPNWLGGSLEYDVNLSGAGCGCNAALYFVKMPGLDYNGNPIPTSGNDYYCDANQVGGQWCPEFDVQEANTYAWHSTPHKCDAPTSSGHYNNCDRGGSCFQIAWQQDQGAYGPGKRINTGATFHVKQEFGQNSFTTTLSQGSNTFTMNSGCDGYYGAISGDLAAGMTIAISSWGEGADMSWLDGETGCGESCYNKPGHHVENISVTTGGSTPPHPPHPPTPPSHDYDYGDACATRYDDDCNGCNCHWSWPKTDPAKWASKDAHCRCM